MSDKILSSPHLIPQPRIIESSSGCIHLGRLPLGIKIEPRSNFKVPEHLNSFFSIDNACKILAIRFSPDIEHPDGYRLLITPDTSHDYPIELFAQTNSGVIHGLATLRQLIIQYQTALPSLSIEDWPAFSVRGVMLDISRDRVPTMSHLFETIDLLASLKFNHLQLYTEHTFAYPSHAEVWLDASPLTPDEIQQLDAYCHLHGISLTANQNCFGHLERWLKHPRYKTLAETTGQWDCLGKTMHGPFSLCPTDPRSIEFISDLLNNLLPNFTHRRVNIGCDETFDVGQGRSRDLVKKLGYATVYAEFVSQIISLVHCHRFKPLFWADIALTHPKVLDMLPQDIIALAWGYEPDSKFDEWCHLLHSKGFENWVCPGTSSWRSFAGRTTERRKNQIVAAQMHSISTGYMVTDWGDEGHRQQWPISILGLAEAASFAWNPNNTPDLTAISLFAFNNPDGNVAKWISDLGDVDQPVRQIAGIFNHRNDFIPLKNASALYKDFHTPWENPFYPMETDLWSDAGERITGLQNRFPNDLSPLHQRELQLTLDIASLAIDRAILRRKKRPPKKNDIKSLASRLNDVITEHRYLWLQRSRPGGLDDSCCYYQTVLNDLNRIIA